MPKPTTESHLALLRHLKSVPSAPHTLPALTELLRTKNLHGIVIKSAVTLAEQCNAKSLASELVQIINALLDKSTAKRDPGCEGKTAAIKALIAWDWGGNADPDAAALYLAAARYRQREPVMGGSIDTAAEFRGLAAHGLVLARPPEALLTIIDLLADAEKLTRQNAAIALGNWPGTESLPALRLKAHLGDDDPDTFAEVLASLLRQDQEQLPFVAQFLQHSRSTTVESAALALGQSKLASALAPLAAAWPKHRGSPIASTLLMSISLLRTDDALDFLLRQLESARSSELPTFLDALALYKSNPTLLPRLKKLSTQHPHLGPVLEQL